LRVEVALSGDRVVTALLLSLMALRHPVAVASRYLFLAVQSAAVHQVAGVNFISLGALGRRVIGRIEVETAVTLVACLVLKCTVLSSLLGGTLVLVLAGLAVVPPSLEQGLVRLVRLLRLDLVLPSLHLRVTLLAGRNSPTDAALPFILGGSGVLSTLLVLRR